MKLKRFRITRHFANAITFATDNADYLLFAITEAYISVARLTHTSKFYELPASKSCIFVLCQLDLVSEHPGLQLY